MEELLNAVMKKKGRTPLDSMALRSLCVAKYPDQDGSVHITFLFYPFSVLGFFCEERFQNVDGISIMICRLTYAHIMERPSPLTFFPIVHCSMKFLSF